LRIKLRKKELRSLLLSLFIPFIAVVLAVLPFAFGLHGTTHSFYSNPSSFGEESGTGHFSGDLFIGENTGWVLCNGKVRFSGQLHVYDANFDYEASMERHSGSFFDFDYQEIRMDGDRGNMLEGVPFFLLGFLGSFVGYVFWLAYSLTKRSSKYDSAIVSLSAFVGIVTVSYLGFNTMCFIILIITLPIAAGLAWSYRRYSRMQKSWFVGISIGVGIFLLVVSALYVIFPDHYGIGGGYYNPILAFMSLFLGMVGAMSSAGLIGWGVGKVMYRREHPVVDRPTPMPCPQCGGPILPEQSHCPHCGLGLR
jgi:hypothetical protein